LFEHDLFRKPLHTIRDHAFEHFQEKWNPVFHPKMRAHKKNRAASVSMETEATLVSSQ
jgi:hypothetical protein